MWRSRYPRDKVLGTGSTIPLPDIPIDATPFAELDNINAWPLPIMPILSRAKLRKLVAESNNSTPSHEATVGLLVLMGLATNQAVEMLIEKFELTASSEMTFLLMNRSGDLVMSIVPSNLHPSVEGAAGDRASRPLLLRRDGTQMVRTSVSLVVQRLSRRSGLDPKIAAESVRQSFIAPRVKDGVPVWTIASETRIHEGTVRNHVAIPPHRWRNAARGDGEGPSCWYVPRV